MIANFIRETTTAPGTNLVATLNGATAPFKSFSSTFSNGATMFYMLRDGTQWETGAGTFNTTPSNQVSRTSVIANSAGTTSRLNFAGTTEVYVTVPAERVTYLDGSMVERVKSGQRARQSTVVKLTANESIANNTETAIPWDAADHDDGTMWSAGFPTRLTVPTNFSRVRITGGITWASNATGTRAIVAKKNGSYVAGLPNVIAASPGAVAFGQSAPGAVVQVTAGDYLELFVTQTSGGSLNLTSAGDVTWLAAELIR